MIAEVGIVTTGLAFLAAVYALFAALFGTFFRRDTVVVSARNAALMTFPLLTVSCLVLIAAMINHKFFISYVWQTSSRSTPDFYLITGLWGSQAGSLLFWSWLMSMFTFAALLLNWHSERRLMPFVIVATMATLGFFLILNNFVENPFKRFWETTSGTIKSSLFSPGSGAIVFTPADGQGLNPLLRDIGMVIHPPMLYLGFVGFTIPFAFAFAALATGQLGSDWLRATRRWALVAWLFLSLGLMLGGWWAYHVLGWGGYWGWDPVENSALLPWLTGTAFLHSAIVQEKRGMLKFWNMLLIIVTFLLVVLGTFATRSGVISSVHAFAESQVGRPMFMFLGTAMITSMVLLFWRQGKGELRGADALDSLYSKEFFFLINNWLFLCVAAIVLWGSWSEAFTTILVDLHITKNVINLGPNFYPVPVGICLIFIYLLMGIAPLAAWRRSTAQRLGRAMAIPTGVALLLIAVLYGTGTHKLWALLGYALITFVAVATLTEIGKGVAARHRRGDDYGSAFVKLIARDRHRYGGYFVHLGMVVLGLGVIGSTAFQKTTAQTLNVGDRLKLDNYQLQYNGLYQAQAADGRTMLVARATVYKDGKIVAHIRPRRDLFFTTNPSTGETELQTNMSIPGVYRTLEGDFYVRIEYNEGNTVTFRAYVKPLINFLWSGGVLLILGTLVALWPSRESRRALQPVTVPSGASGAHAGED